MRRRAVPLTGVVVLATALFACCFGACAAEAGVVNTLLVGKNPYGVSSDGTHVWVTNRSDGTVSEIEASSGAVLRTIETRATAGVDNAHAHGVIEDDGHRDRRPGSTQREPRALR